MAEQQRRYEYAVNLPARAASRPLGARVMPAFRLNRWVIASMSLALLLALGLGLILTGVYASFNLFNLIVPGVQVNGVDLGGLTLQQAQRRLETGWAGGGTVAVSDGKNAWQVSPGTMGFSIDAAATVEQAYFYGRTQGNWVSPLALVFYETQEAAPVVNFDPAAARAMLQQAAKLIDKPAVEASVRFEGGHWKALPGSSGSVVNIDATLLAWQVDPAQLLKMGQLPLTMSAVDPQVMDASAQAARLEHMLQSPLVVQAYDPITNESFNWQVPQETLAGWVRVQDENGQPAMHLDSQALDAFAQQMSSSLGEQRFVAASSSSGVDAAWQSGQPIAMDVKYRPTSYVVEAGDNLVSIAFKTGIPWWKIRDANPGINPDQLNAGGIITIPPKDANLPLPVIKNKRVVISISQQRLWTYENGQQRTQSVISTGIARSPTMPGVFQVQTHDENAYASNWDLWMPNFLGIYEAAPGFMNGIHGLPLLSSGVRLWANVLGQPASYGCIILTLDEAEDLYQWADNGVVVEIQP